MTQTNLTSLQAVVIEKLDLAKLDMETARIKPGKQDFDFVVHVKGSVNKLADTSQVPTCRALTLETMALFIARMGFQRELAISTLVEVMQDNVKRNKDQKAALLQLAGVDVALERVNAEMAKLPKTPVSGQTRVAFEIVETVPQFLGDAFVPHAEAPAVVEAPAEEANVNAVQPTAE